MMAQSEPYTPLWWAARLFDMLRRRQPEIQRYDEYYRGDHPLPGMPPQIAEEARRFLRLSRSNYMGLVVDAMTERMEPVGFRFGDDASGDEQAWRIWQANSLDGISPVLFLEAAKCGSAYLLVAPNMVDATLPIATIEHSAQVIVDYEPGSMTRRAAGLKVWYDDAAKLTMATLYLPDAIYKWQGGRRSSPSAWEPRRVAGESWPAGNPLGVVPLVELRNNPQFVYCDGRLSFEGVSEMRDLTDIQDRINKTLADRMLTQDTGAWPQKWATDWPNDEEVDDQGQPVPPSESTGNPPLDIGRDRLVVAPEGVQFGQWDSAPLDPYSRGKVEDVKDIASRSRTPSQYLLGEMVNMSGDALKAAESGLVAKVRQRSRPIGEALEEAIRLMLRLAGDPRGEDVAGEVIWRNPEFRTEGEVVDALVKMSTLGVPREELWSRWGATPQQIARWKTMNEQQLGQALTIGGLTAALTGPKPGDVAPVV